MQTILITGASSGIGEALALAYAGAGTTLGLLGRNAERLESVAARCRERGATVRTAAIDVRARAELKAWIEAFDREHPVDLLVANAGVMAGTPPGGDIERADTAAALIETNVGGVLNTVQPLLPPMMARGRGQIAIVGSLAGFIPLPDAPSYSASKSAVLSYGLSLRALARAARHPRQRDLPGLYRDADDGARDRAAPIQDVGRARRRKNPPRLAARPRRHRISVAAGAGDPVRQPDARSVAPADPEPISFLRHRTRLRVR